MGLVGTIFSFFILMAVWSPFIWVFHILINVDYKAPSCLKTIFVGFLFLVLPPIGWPIAALCAYTRFKKKASGVGDLGALASALTRAASAGAADTFLIRSLLNDDPNFSVPIFREFFVSLYAQALVEMPTGVFSHAGPYLDSRASSILLERGRSLKEVREVIVGSMRLVSYRKSSIEPVYQEITVELEANYRAVSAASDVAYVTRETWVLRRKSGLLTKPPRPIPVLSCPNCGYRGELPTSGVCPQCDTDNRKGEYNWQAYFIRIDTQEEFTPYEGAGVEAGTLSPTRYDRELGRLREEFMTRHPNFSWDALWDETTAIFLRLQRGWSERKPGLCRPFETDAVFRVHCYGIEDLVRRRRINNLKDISVTRWELTKITIDAYYESITARVFASMIDFTTDEDGELISGDPNKPTSFSEYWTFIRRIGSKEAKANMESCPSCGAPIEKINWSGECDHCGSFITLGDFGWVLSNIEQD